MQIYELNIDGLVGPTHHYAGLSPGNMASTNNALKIANPQAAALQGLAKMRFLHQTGIKQAVFPPHQRPNLDLLYQLGFTGTPIQQITKAKSLAPELLSAAYSASSMWAANTATISSSLDSMDRRVQFTSANLISNLHRSQESEFSKQLLQYLFNNKAHFQHHAILPKSMMTSDEGAANHSRLCESHNKAGIALFVYGKRSMHSKTKHFPARQTFEACAAIARQHKLEPDKVIFACQNPETIDQGVFHNDVIAVANESVLLLHEHAFVDQALVLDSLIKKADFPLNILEVKESQISIKDAVKTYFFNAQLITKPDNSMMLIAAADCEKHAKTKAYIQSLVEDPSNPISKVHYFDLKQSMQNGGGPACLRLRVPVTKEEFQAIHPGIIINNPLLDALEKWVRRHYRTHLHFDDLADPLLMKESFMALDELTILLNLGSIYPFQKE